MTYKDIFCEALRKTNREGIENVITNLDQLGFFQAPASTAFHLNTEGGLVQHSVNVYVEALAIRESQIKMRPEIAEKLPLDSIAIAALLHDVCKADIYKQTIKNRKRPDGVWEKYAGYEVDYSAFPAGHGEKSVIRLLQWGLQLTNDEILAIRWHMEAWDLAFQSPDQKANLGMAKNISPLMNVVKAADGLASFILETGNVSDSDSVANEYKRLTY